MRQFFHATLHPNNFVSGAAPRFPTSMLAWVSQFIAMQSTIPMSTRFPKRWAVAAASRDQARRQLLPGQAATGEMWQGVASAMWGAQQPPPAPAPSFKIPTPAQSAPQQWYPPAGHLPPAPPTLVGSGGGGNAASQVHPGFFGIATPVANRNNGYLSIGAALTLVGKRFSDLPTLALPVWNKLQALRGTRSKECAH